MDEKKDKSINMGLPIFAFIISLSLLSSIFPGLASIFIYDRGAILGGEVWRLLTCHFVHFSNAHIAYNILAFGIAGFVIEKKQYPNFVLLCLCLAICISTSLAFSHPKMAFYGGLSGIACGAIYYCGLMGMGINKATPWQRICLLVVLFLPLKIAIEIFTNAPILLYEENQTFVPMHASHILGCAVAVFFYIAVKIRIRKSRSSKTLNLTPRTSDSCIRWVF